MSFSNYFFTAEEILRTNEPVPVQSVKPYFEYSDKERKTPLGSVFTVLIPDRGYASLSVEVPGSTAYQEFEAGTQLYALFDELAAKPYAFRTERGSLSSGFSAVAGAVHVVDNIETL